MTPLDRTSPMPLWAQLQQELTRRLAAGAFGGGFPGELELVQSYDVSRHTVREALRRLRETGMIDSARGRGTWVRGGTAEHPVGALAAFFHALEEQDAKLEATVLRQEAVTDADAAGHLGLTPDAPLFLLERVRLADGEPLAHDRAWMPLDLARPLLDADFRRGTMREELAARCGLQLTAGEERVTAVTPTREQRDDLAVPRGVACLSVERLGRVRGETAEYRRVVLRGDRACVTSSWTPHGAAVGATVTAPRVRARA